MKASSVYLMLGDKCNFSCRYCLQREKFTEPLPTFLDRRVVDYINSLDIAKTFNRRTNSYNERINLLFYGGEPLLYFNSIKYIVPMLNRDKFTLGIISNGSLLTDEMVDFFNRNDIHFALSNDGNNSKDLRGENVLENPEVFERFMCLQKKSISCVLSAVNYDLRDIWSYFEKKFPEHIHLNYDWIMDTGHLPKDLCQFDFKDFQEYLTCLNKELKRKFEHGDMTLLEANFLLQMMTSIESHDRLLGEKHCSTVERMLNIDTEGNIYLCHNSCQVLGTIEDNYAEIVERYSLHDKYAKSFECMNCMANPICRGGCILVGEKARESYYCDMQKTIMKSFVEVWCSSGN